MSQVWDETVLYHGISSYQLLEVILHRKLRHPRAWAALVLPDFLEKKYPWWRDLESKGWFQAVRLFPYLHIPHREQHLMAQDAQAAYRRLGLPPLGSFSKIYVAGAHFCFSLCPLGEQVPFTLLEDAAGLLSRPQEAAAALGAKYPQQAAMAQELGLFTGENPLIDQVICLVKAQRPGAALPSQVEDFSVEQALEGLSPRERRRLVGLFVSRPTATRAQSILLTQQFSALGLLTPGEQAALYLGLGQGLLRDVPLLVKRHPDDPLDYRALFPGAQVMADPFPAELLPYVFRGRRPQRVYAFGSASLHNLGDHFETVSLPMPQPVRKLFWEGRPLPWINPCT